jgi:membrane associated rhomboid family serine protease
MFLVMYLLAIIVASLPSFYKNRNNSYYRALGASGGVSAVLFSFIYFQPWAVINIWFIPCPAILAGIGYLVYSAYMSGKGRDNVGHDAHLWGAVWGLVFTFFYDPTHGQNFIIQLMHPHFL